MRKFQAVPGPYYLHLPRPATHWTLKAGEEIVAKLGYKQQFICTAEFAEGRWTIEQKVEGKIEVRDSESGADVATLKDPGSAGTWLRSQWPSPLNGGSFEWCRFFQNRPVFKDTQGSVLVRFKLNFSATKARVLIEPRALTVPDLPVLVVVGCYIIITTAEESINTGEY